MANVVAVVAVVVIGAAKVGGLYLDSDALVLRDDVLVSLRNAYGSLHACVEMLKPQRMNEHVRVAHGNNAVLRFTAGHYFLFEYMHAQVRAARV